MNKKASTSNCYFRCALSIDLAVRRRKYLRISYPSAVHLLVHERHVIESILAVQGLPSAVVQRVLVPSAVQFKLGMVVFIAPLNMILLHEVRELRCGGAGYNIRVRIIQVIATPLGIQGQNFASGVVPKGAVGRCHGLLVLNKSARVPTGILGRRRLHPILDEGQGISGSFVTGLELDAELD